QLVIETYGGLELCDRALRLTSRNQAQRQLRAKYRGVGRDLHGMLQIVCRFGAFTRAEISGAEQGQALSVAQAGRDRLQHCHRTVGVATGEPNGSQQPSRRQVVRLEREESTDLTVRFRELPLSEFDRAEKQQRGRVVRHLLLNRSQRGFRCGVVLLLKRDESLEIVAYRQRRRAGEHLVCRSVGFVELVLEDHYPHHAQVRQQVR